LGPTIRLAFRSIADRVGISSMTCLATWVAVSYLNKLLYGIELCTKYLPVSY